MRESLLGRMRRRIIMPDRSEVTFAKRGFDAPDATRRDNLENVGHRFLDGFSYGIAGSSIADIESSLETVDRAYRGFAYEGCAMALAVRDGLVSFRPWVSTFLAGRASEHVYMVYIGVGWAMARLPRIRWRAVTPADPLLSWLALDGYGFHQAYFHTARYVKQQYQGRIPGWEPQDYANRAVDQGIGRALWFINGSDPARVADTIHGFAPARRGDLWSGAALASVYAGGADAGELAVMMQRADGYRSHAAQGAAFAAQARLRADLVTPGTELGVKVCCDTSVQEAAAITDSALTSVSAMNGQDSPVPRFELWRAEIRKRFE